jgi:hypothetical protein
VAVIIPLIITVETLRMQVLQKQTTYIGVKNDLSRTLTKPSTRAEGTPAGSEMDLRLKLWAKRSRTTIN